MKLLSYAPLALLLLTLPVKAQATAAAMNGVPATSPTDFHYFDPASVDLKTLLPDPPADGSPETKAEIDLILEKQKARTPEEVERIKREVKLNVYLFDTVLGDWFTAKNLPLTATLFQKVDETEVPIIMSAKKDWHRPRPFKQDSRVKPPIDLPKNDSYPSGHATFGLLNALILAQLAPDLKDQLVARGTQIGDDRIIAGVHFPSDVEAGHKVANALFAKFVASPAFQADLAAAKTEFDAARPKH